MFDFEFNANLKDHKIGNQDIYRLYYKDYRRSHVSYCIHETDAPYEPFKLPEGMLREDAFKVLSYLTDCIEKKYNFEECPWQSVSTLDKVLNIEKLGFKRIDRKVADQDIINLYTVAGRVLFFKFSKHYHKYFEWYTENVTRDEVIAIYKKCNMEFSDIYFENNNHEQARINEKKLVRKINY